MQTKDTTTSDLQNDLHQVKEKLQETHAALSQTAEHAKTKAQEYLHDKLGHAKEQTEELQENVITYIRKNPVKSLGLGFAAGILAALLLRK
ncbi:MAG: hypothetical protein P4M14_04315 [Gammaproteobacteria bacterium]|nr:hypothetical protein [Gammaproteobacteria bacterium]